MRYAQNHADQFIAIATMIGLLDFPRTGLPEGQSYQVPLGRFGKAPAVWNELNPINHAEALQGMSVLILTADQAFDRTMNVNFSNRLKQINLPHEFRMLKGGHTFPVVRESVPLVIRFMNQKLTTSTLD